MSANRPRRLMILAEGYSGDPHWAKTMNGVLRYGQDEVVAILDSTRVGGEERGVPILGDVASVLPLRPEAALVGVATVGGRFPLSWRELLRECIRQGIGIDNGLHEFIEDDPELASLAAASGATLRDLRRPPSGLEVATGANLEVPGDIVLTVGSDCAIGKMTVSLELAREAGERGISARFVPTGQTGIAIAGWGISVDAVVADFIAGAAERLVVEGGRRGGELLLVEGQGSLSHPGYSGVTLGLIHGAAPHAFVLCHMAGATEIDGYPGHPLLPLAELVELHERVSLPCRRAAVACIALNTRNLDDSGARAAVAAAEAETGLVADDPLRFGSSRLLDALIEHLARLPGRR
ncbi:MAG: DUF1611 domain-containing protein [Thermoleophilia bacterium]